MVRGGKGLSNIVSTLIIILLVFVAVGLLWVSIRNFVKGGSSSIDLSSKCVEITVSPTKVVNNSGVYNVTLLRNGGTGEIGGIRLVFSREDADSNFIYDIPGNLDALALMTASVQVTGITNPNKVEAIVYFMDDSGKVGQYCQNSEELNF